MGAGSPIALNSSGEAPDEIMVLPAGNVLTTVDGRGPYRIADVARLATQSLKAAGGRLAIDENHSTDLAAPKGEPSPARGWVTELHARADGMWARVDWNAPGAALIKDRAYRFISPVFTHDKAGNVTGLLRASLTNTPNLRGMAALHSTENNMDLLAQLRKLLGLPDDADEAAVIAKITELNADETVATNAALKPIAKAAGLKGDADTTTIVTAVTALKSGTALQSIAKAAGLKGDEDAAAITTAVTALAAGTGPIVIALQAEVKDLGERLNASVIGTATDKATAYVDGEIARGRVGVKPMRDRYIAMHAKNPSEAEALIGAMPIVGASGALTTPPANKDGTIALNAEQLNAAKILGINPEEYRKTLAAEQSAA